MKKTWFSLLAVVLALFVLIVPVTAGADSWTMPVPSGATANYIPYFYNDHELRTRSTELTDGVVYVGPQEGTGYVSTWTLTREAAGRQSYVRTAAADNGFLVFDITEVMRSTASKGMKLSSIQYAFGVADNTLDAHTLGLYKTTFVDNTAASTAIVQTISSIYKTAGTVTSPYIRTATISSPAFLNPFPDATTNYKWTIEINVDATSYANTTYRFYGMWLVFTYDNL